MEGAPNIAQKRQGVPGGGIFFVGIFAQVLYGLNRIYWCIMYLQYTRQQGGNEPAIRWSLFELAPIIPNWDEEEATRSRKKLSTTLPDWGGAVRRGEPSTILGTARIHQEAPKWVM